MATVRPFRALRPRPDVVERVASVPYDVVNTEEARALADGNPHSFLRVIRPEINLPPDAPYDQLGGHRKGAEQLAQMVSEGIFEADAASTLYVYRQIMDGRSQVGVVGCCSVDEYDDGRIKKHEKTRPDKEADRTHLMLELGAQPGPVFLTYPDDHDIDLLVDEAIASHPPIYDFVAADGVSHTVWRVDDPSWLAAAFGRVAALYVADGHHRSASASRARATRRAANPDHQGTEEYNYFLSVLFPAGQLRIMAYNRVVHDLNGLTPEELLSRIGLLMDTREGGDPEPPAAGRFSMYLDGRWWDLEAPETLTQDPDPVRSLDAEILQSFVLGPLLGIQDPRTSERIDFVGGIRGTQTLADQVDGRGDGVAFSLYPVQVEQLIAVADAGLVLPPKSTWFEPKLRSGLFVHEI